MSYRHSRLGDELSSFSRKQIFGHPREGGVQLTLFKDLDDTTHPWLAPFG